MWKSVVELWKKVSWSSDLSEQSITLSQKCQGGADKFF